MLRDVSAFEAACSAGDVARVPAASTSGAVSSGTPAEAAPADARPIGDAAQASAAGGTRIGRLFAVVFPPTKGRVEKPPLGSAEDFRGAVRGVRAGLLAVRPSEIGTGATVAAAGLCFWVALHVERTVDGLAIGFGPTITIAEGGVELVPTLTYRSHLGAIDPRVEGTGRLGRRTRLHGDVGRGTFSNDRWIRGIKPS